MANTPEQLNGPVDWTRPALLEGTSQGFMPWESRRWAWILPLIILPFLAISTIWAVQHIEEDVEEAAEELLIDAGIDTSNLTFNATYRDVEVKGKMASGTDRGELVQILERGTGPDNADIRTATVAASDAPPPLFGPIALDARSDGITLTLTGSVPSQSDKDEILNAADATGLIVADAITVSGLEPSSSDAAGQIKKFSSAVGGLLNGYFETAELLVGDTGPVTGTIAATSPEFAELLDGVSGDDVTVTSPPTLESLDVSVVFDGTRIVLNGTVFSMEQNLELAVASSSVVGTINVVNNLAVTDLPEAVPGSAARVSALASVISTFDDLTSADATINDTDITVNGEAEDSAGQAATATAVAATGAANLRPGGEVRVVAPPAPELSLEEEIDLLQAELDSLQDEIRETVVFATDSDELAPSAQVTLDKVVDAMNRYSRPVVETGGHTDSEGEEEYNRDLSQRRADAVVGYISSSGIDPERLRSVGFGETQPLADNSTQEGRLQNRRVEFFAKEGF